MPALVALPPAGGTACAAGGSPSAVPVGGPVSSVAIVLRGPQGPQGSSDYGFVRYDETGPAAVPLTENVQSPFRLIQPTMLTDTLRSPFAGRVYLDSDGMTLRPRKAGDSYLVRIRLSVVTTRAGGTFQVNLFVTGNTTTLQGANSTRSVNLAAPSGTSERVDLMYQLFPGTGFVANGGLFQMQSTVPMTVIPESLFITPLVAAP